MNAKQRRAARRAKVRADRRATEIAEFWRKAGEIMAPLGVVDLRRYAKDAGVTVLQ